MTNGFLILPINSDVNSSFYSANCSLLTTNAPAAKAQLQFFPPAYYCSDVEKPPVTCLGPSTTVFEEQKQQQQLIQLEQQLVSALLKESVLKLSCQDQFYPSTASYPSFDGPANIFSSLKVPHQAPPQFSPLYLDTRPSPYSISRLKKHVCPQCGKSFNQLSNLKDHVKIHIPDELLYFYSCPVCSKKCKLKGNLKKHLRMHYRNQDDVERVWSSLLPTFEE